MIKRYTLLRPIQSKALRLTFAFENQPDNKVSPFEVMKASIIQFEKFAISRFFWFIVDLKNWKNVCGGGEIEKMTPLKTNDFWGGSHQKIHDMTHPVDLHHVNAFSKFWVNFYLSMPPERRPYSRMTLYFRIMNSMEEYYWIMVQYADSILDSENKFVYGLVFATDISHLKKDGQPMMSILDTYDGDCHQFFCTDQSTLIEKKLSSLITIREREVLHYLTNGYSSKQIASKLGISIKTIDNHRQNMLHRTNSKSTGELIAYCVKNGLI